jgi:hypothetical protein
MCIAAMNAAMELAQINADAPKPALLPADAPVEADVTAQPGNPYVDPEVVADYYRMFIFAMIDGVNYDEYRPIADRSEYTATAVGG